MIRFYEIGLDHARHNACDGVGVNESEKNGALSANVRDCHLVVDIYANFYAYSSPGLLLGTTLA